MDDVVSRVGLEGHDLSRVELESLGELPLDELERMAGEVRACGPLPSVVTFSPKVFVPLTFACRDHCGYCTFAADPDAAGGRVFMSVDEVLAVAEAG